MHGAEVPAGASGVNEAAVVAEPAFRRVASVLEG